MSGIGTISSQKFARIGHFRKSSAYLKVKNGYLLATFSESMERGEEPYP